MHHIMNKIIETMLEDTDPHAREQAGRLLSAVLDAMSYLEHGGDAAELHETLQVAATQDDWSLEDEMSWRAKKAKMDDRAIFGLR